MEDALEDCDCEGVRGALALWEHVARPLPVAAGLDEPVWEPVVERLDDPAWEPLAVGLGEPLAVGLAERGCEPLPDEDRVTLCVADAVLDADAVPEPDGVAAWLPVVEGVRVVVAERDPDGVRVGLELVIDDDVDVGLGVGESVPVTLGDWLLV